MLDFIQIKTLKLEGLSRPDIPPKISDDESENQMNSKSRRISIIVPSNSFSHLKSVVVTNKIGTFIGTQETQGERREKKVLPIQ